MNYPRKNAHFLVLTIYIFLVGCQKQDPKKKNPSFEDLKEDVEMANNENNSDAVTAYLEKMISKFPDHPNIPDFKIRLADQYLKEEKFDSAYEFFQHFSRLYPSHEKVEYARYQAIIAKYYQTLQINRECDASTTRETIDLCRNYLSDSSRPNRNKIMELQAACEERLIDKEIHVYDSYLRRGKYKSAANRLIYLKDNFLNKDSSLKPRILYLECKLAQKQNDDKLATQNLQTLIAQYPESQFTRMAEGLMSRGRLFA
ncbi:outer membrane protein assembly factor BamD [Candidatus Dependentiae bacterium]